MITDMLLMTTDMLLMTTDMLLMTTDMLLMTTDMLLMTTDMLKQGETPLNNLMNRASCAFLASLSFYYEPTASLS
jgi:hypothetical protein